MNETEFLQSYLIPLLREVRSDPTKRARCHEVSTIIAKKLTDLGFKAETVLGNVWIKHLETGISTSFTLENGGSGHQWNKVIFNNVPMLLDIAIFHQLDVHIPADKPVFFSYGLINVNGAFKIRIDTPKGSFEVVYQDSTVANHYSKN